MGDEAEHDEAIEAFERGWDAAAGTDASVAEADPRGKCDHICLKDGEHVERGEPHFYGYEHPSPRRAEAENRELRTLIRQLGEQLAHVAAGHGSALDPGQCSLCDALAAYRAALDSPETP
jgi:hypothetical protein